MENRIRILRSEIKKNIDVLQRLEDYIGNFKQNQLGENPGTDEAMVITQSLTNYYTCLETIFLRISKFFENNLDKDQWHRSLLEKMTLEIEDIRPKVISDNIYNDLLELLKFRHFSRYYFELNYDWDKLMFLLKKFENVKNRIKKDFIDFDNFLWSLVKKIET
jgi:hypothetical protein